MLVDEFNRTYFGNQLSDDVVTVLKVLDQSPPHIRENAWRLLKNYVDAGYSPFDLSLQIADQISKTNVLFDDHGKPKAAPYTSKKRHYRLDHLLQQMLPHFQGRILEVGCGYPPFTAYDLAQTFPLAQVVGMEPLFPAFSIEDSKGYALLNEQGKVMTLHANTFEGMSSLHSNFEQKRASYEQLFHTFQKNPGASHPGVSIDLNPLSKFSLPNLKFKTGQIGDDLEGSFDCIRAMNVLIFFDQGFRRDFYIWASAHLKEGGTIVVGANTFDSTYLRATVWKKRNGDIEFERFIFASESVRAMGGVASFATPSASDRELACQKKVIRILRQNKSILEAFDQLMDIELVHRGLAQRDEQNYLNHPTLETTLGELVEISEKITTQLLGKQMLEELNRFGVGAEMMGYGVISVQGSLLESIATGKSDV